MNTPEPQITTRQSQATHWPSVFQFGFSLFAILSLWGMAGSLLLLAFTSVLIQETNENTAIMLSAVGLLIAGVVLLPSGIYSFLRLINRPSQWKPNLKYAGWLVLLLPPAIIAGHFAAQNDLTAFLILPPFHIVVVCVSVFLLLMLGKRGISIGSPQRTWGVFTGGLVLAPLFSLLAEMLLFLLIAILGGIYLARDPALLNNLADLSDQLMLNPESQEAVLEFLDPILAQPGVIFGVLTVMSVFIPLIEELFKPIGVWFLVGRKLGPAQGFAAGLLSGAGYALFENFALAASSGEEWASIVLARMGTSAMHILTAGISGYALAQTWQKRRFIRLGFAYLLAVAIHGCWNGLVILTAVPELESLGLQAPPFLVQTGKIAPAGLVFLLVSLVAILLFANFRLRRAIIPPAHLQPVNVTPLSEGANLNEEK